MKKNIRIDIIGCDDSTIFDITVSEDELVFLEKLCKLSKETSEYGCQPIIEFEELN